MFRPLVGTEPGLVFYARLDEGVGVPVVDSSPTGLTGGVSGNPVWTAPGAPLCAPECSDELDNDGDGRVDFDGGGVGDADPQCLNQPFKDRERARRGCGIGFELAVLLPPLIWLHRRRRNVRGIAL